METIKSRFLSYDEYQNKVVNLKTASDVTNFAKDLIAPTLQAMLEADGMEITINSNFQRSL